MLKKPPVPGRFTLFKKQHIGCDAGVGRENALWPYDYPQLIIPQSVCTVPPPVDLLPVEVQFRVS